MKVSLAHGLRHTLRGHSTGGGLGPVPSAEPRHGQRGCTRRPALRLAVQLYPAGNHRRARRSRRSDRGLDSTRPGGGQSHPSAKRKSATSRRSPRVSNSRSSAAKRFPITPLGFKRWPRKAGWALGDVVTNLNQEPRVLLIDPALRLGTAEGRLPYTQPVAETRSSNRSARGS